MKQTSPRLSTGGEERAEPGVPESLPISAVNRGKLGW
jgi:hypothetical protein